jgi:hypothetical protein
VKESQMESMFFSLLLFTNYSLGTLMFDVIDIKIPNCPSKSKIGCYAALGKKILDVLVISDLEQQLSVPITEKSEDIQLVIKTLNTDPKYQRNIGSITIPIALFLSVKPNKKITKWVTLFDTINDDMYDGDFTEDDNEQPMIQVEFFRLSKKVKRVAGGQAAPVAKAKTQESQKVAEKPK